MELAIRAISKRARLARKKGTEGSRQYGQLLPLALDNRVGKLQKAKRSRDQVAGDFYFGSIKEWKSFICAFKNSLSCLR